MARRRATQQTHCAPDRGTNCGANGGADGCAKRYGQAQ
eukprot:CAMPEP_0183470248 /NCGR_PEP_ID=MMETSP0370-20130417/155881_1 /TAXON_ID=268820 /ORGANISM="Peridinium aciculiferum, Strain PAER-2" /LENGTH=37 /DNA_ID= /DNA_START= /DNA_END= /DNA_ORIENTATION=